MEQLDRMSLEDKVFAGDASMTSAKNKMLIRDTKKELMRYNKAPKHTWSDLQARVKKKKKKTFYSWVKIMNKSDKKYILICFIS